MERVFIWKSSLNTTKVMKIKGNNNIQVAGDLKIDNFIYLQKKFPAKVAKIVYHLSKHLDNPVEIFNFQDKNLYYISEKIEYNNLIKYKGFIEDYGNYGSTIDSIYTSLDSEVPNTKKRFLQFINIKYKEVLGDLIRKSPDKTIRDIVQVSSDDIMDYVFEKLKETYNASEVIDVVDIEDLNTCLICIICKAFIDCKILEIPKNDFTK